MGFGTKAEILEILKMDDSCFQRDILPLAAQTAEKALGKKLRVTSMMGYTNICKNNCLYCGMRAGNPTLHRYRIPAEEVISSCVAAADLGFGRAFLIAGEDPKYGFENLLTIIRALKKRGMFVSLACGEMTEGEFLALQEAGTDEYVLKFEMSHRDSFNRLNPSTDYDRRLHTISMVRKAGMKLASGNIIDWPGQTAEELADDILLMKELEISWAPVIPYLPAANTPLAAEKKRGDLGKLYREIAILRLMMPDVHITAQQPGEVMQKGLSDPEGNYAAVQAGADTLFFDLLSAANAESFRVIDDRNIVGTSHLYRLSEMTGYGLDTGKELVQ